MKKTTYKRKHWHEVRARNEARRSGRVHRGWGFSELNAPSKRKVSRVQIWQGEDPEWALCLGPPIAPPNPLCLDENREFTFKLFSDLRRGFNKALKEGTSFVDRPKTPGAWPRIQAYFNFARLRSISTASAVILAAEYDRMRSLQGVIPPTVELDKWNDEVFTKLFQLGFFEITGHASSNSSKLTENGQSLSMRIVRSEAANDLQEIDEALQKLFGFLGADGASADPITVEFLTALSEAMTNVTNHAYTEEIEFTAPHVPHFWVAATADKTERSITIVVYDQGHTIPATYPRLDRLDKVKNFLARAIRRPPEHPFEFDGTFIRAAMRFGGSRTDQRHRGKGLPQMFTALQKIGKGALTVYSRGGWCQRSSEGRMQSGSMENAIGGTLVEWTVVIP